MPNGFLLCNGASVSRNDYPDLADALGETADTFSLPDYRDRVPQGAGTVSPNVEIEAGLPDVSGSFWSREAYWSSDVLYVLNQYSGAFKVTHEDSSYSYGVSLDSLSAAQPSCRCDISASSSNSLYSGTTVQMAAYTNHFLIKV